MVSTVYVPDAFADAEAKDEDVEVKLSSILESEAPWFVVVDISTLLYTLKRRTRKLFSPSKKNVFMSPLIQSV